MYYTGLSPRGAVQLGGPYPRPAGVIIHPGVVVAVPSRRYRVVLRVYRVDPRVCGVAVGRLGFRRVNPVCPCPVLGDLPGFMHRFIPARAGQVRGLRVWGFGGLGSKFRAVRWRAAFLAGWPAGYLHLGLSPRGRGNSDFLHPGLSPRGQGNPGWEALVGQQTQVYPRPGGVTAAGDRLHAGVPGLSPSWLYRTYPRLRRGPNTAVGPERAPNLGGLSPLRRGPASGVSSLFANFNVASAPPGLGPVP